MVVTDFANAAKYGAHLHDFRFDAYDWHLSDEMASRDTNSSNNNKHNKCGK